MRRIIALALLAAVALPSIAAAAPRYNHHHRYGHHNHGHHNHGHHNHGHHHHHHR